MKLASVKTTACLFAITLLTTSAFAAEWREIETTLRLLTNMTDDFKDKPLRFDLDLCTGANQDCQTLAKSEDFTYTGGAKTLHKIWTIHLTRDVLEKAIKKRALENNAYLQVRAVSSNKTLAEGLGDFGGPMKMWLSSFTTPPFTNQAHTWNDKTGEVRYFSSETKLIEK